METYFNNQHFLRRNKINVAKQHPNNNWDAFVNVYAALCQLSGKAYVDVISKGLVMSLFVFVHWMEPQEKRIIQSSTKRRIYRSKRKINVPLFSFFGLGSVRYCLETWTQ